MLHNDRLYIIDFQDARMGPDTYDLASLLRDSYMDFSEQQVEALIAFFLARRNASKADDADFRRRFDLMALQRNLKALGTFGFQTTSRGNPVYIQYIPRTLSYARANLARYERFSRLRSLLADHLEELAVTTRAAPRCPLPAVNIDCLAEPRFGVSTHLFHESRLTREHLVHIAAHGFDAVEVFATRSHFDYHDEAAIDSLAEWLSDTRLTLQSVHAPIFEGLQGGQWVGPFSNATSDERRRAAALAETRAALAMARRLPVSPSGRPSRDSIGRPCSLPATTIGWRPGEAWKTPWHWRRNPVYGSRSK